MWVDTAGTEDTWLQVTVPVLSVQITLTQPSASTVGSFFTIACNTVGCRTEGQPQYSCRTENVMVFLSDSHLSVAHLGGDSKGKFRKEMFTFWCQLGGTFLVADGP